MNETKNFFDNLSIDKSEAHRIIMNRLIPSYKGRRFNLVEFARLADLTEARTRKLILGTGIWTVEEWFKVLVLLDKPAAMTQMYRYAKRDLSKYQNSARFRKIRERYGYD